MGFTLERQTDRLQAKEVRGNYQKVAVACWFTSNGRSMPRMVKYEDEEGTIRSIRNIHLIKTEEKYFAGIKIYSPISPSKNFVSCHTVGIFFQKSNSGRLCSSVSFSFQNRN